jgi:hypothetical protein
MATDQASLPKTPLPTEILHDILHHLADDKHTLAQCMRVSSSFNSLVAPKLYRSVTLSGSTGLFKHLSPPWYAPPRKTQTKKWNMAYITEVEYEYHGAAECSDRQSRHATLSTPVLRIKKPHIRAGSRAEFWSDACSCPRAFISQKAVSPNNAADRNNFSIPWSNHVRRPIDRTVLISDCFFERSSHVMGVNGYDPQSGPLVLVFWSDPL